MGVLSPEVEDFVRVAQRYCDLVETAHHLQLEDRLIHFAEALSELYGKALKLPDVPPATDALISTPTTGLADWPGFGLYEGYFEVFDPYEAEAAVKNTLSDDLLDIHRDLKPGLAAYASGSADTMTDAVWEWRFSFTTHWGDHAVDALRVLHRAACKASGMAAPGG